MDLPHSDTTSELALRSALAEFSAHPELPLLTTAYMALRHREALEQGHTATADMLVRLAVSDAAASMVDELDRRIRDKDSPRFGEFRHPTVLVGLWRDPETRPALRKLVRKHYLMIRPSGLTWQHVSTWLQFAADHERQHREMLMADLLIGLAERATQPDECVVARVARHARAFENERDVAELLREHGHLDQAADHTRRALFHLFCADNLARGWTPDAHVLIRAVRGALSWQLGWLGYETTRKLVGVALHREITRGQARYAFKSASK